MPARLTDTAIAKALRETAAAGKRRDLSDVACPGLRLRVAPSGGATWVLACRDRLGRMRRFTIGPYPAKGLSVAREEARALHVRVKQEGADPTAERRRERAKGEAARLGTGTLAGLLDVFEQQQGSRLKTWPEYRRAIKYVFKPLLRQPLSALTTGDIQLRADGYRAKQAAAAAVRYLRPVLKWAAAPGRGYVDVTLTLIHPPATVRRRDRVLSRDELASLLPVLRASNRPYAPGLRFMLLTLCRREEACSARWRDVDWQAGTWTIPETKNGQPHVVPLSRQAIELLQAYRPATPDPDGLVFATRTGAPLGNWDRETKALQQESHTANWQRHDLRRTGATMLGEMGELPDIIEAALNHVAIRSPLAATYNRARYRPQVAAALQRLADALDGIEAGAAAVVTLHRAAG